MKRLLALLSCLVLVLGLCACSKNDQPIEDQPQVQVARFDCHEFNLEGQYFTDNILLSINLTSDFESTDQSVLLIQDNKYYIGEFKRKDAEGNVNKTVSVFELNDPDFNIVNDCSKVSPAWSISNASMTDENSYMRIFYTEISGYTIGMSIVNTDKSTLSIDDALQNLAFMLNEECTAPLPLEEQSVVVEGTLDSPARVGEWVSTVIYNPVVGEYEPVCISITGVDTGYLADKVVEDYNNSLDQYNSDIRPRELTSADNQWAVYRYSIFFPSSYTTEGKITGVIAPITYCNKKDDAGGAVGGNLNITESLLDISPEMKNVKAGTIWTGGVGFYEIPISVNSEYLIKIAPGEGITTKYFKP